MSSPDDNLDKIKEVFNELPPVPDEQLPPLLCNTQGQCEFCKKFIPITSMAVLDSGIISAQEPLCPECAGTFKEQARIICIPCKQVVLWVDPHKEKLGFEFKARHCYHVNECPSCKEGITHTRILEKVVFFKERNIPYE